MHVCEIAHLQSCKLKDHVTNVFLLKAVEDKGSHNHKMLDSLLGSVIKRGHYLKMKFCDV